MAVDDRDAVTSASEPGQAPDAVRFGSDGLVPAVVQDAADGRVLMVAYMDAEALEATLRTGEVHFHSRSRGRLWRKGESSGNVLRLRGLALDCDGDSLLVQAEPAGPTCHRGTRSCFDAGILRVVEPGAIRIDGMAGGTEAGAAPPRGSGRAVPQGFEWLETLSATIDERAAERPTGSYTTHLLDGGVDAVARKLTEEATEVLLAARDDAEAERSGAERDGTRTALAGEAADLLYHALVLLAERGLEPRAVLEVLRARHGA